MLSVYLACLGFGGILVAASAIGGHGDHGDSGHPGGDAGHDDHAAHDHAKGDGTGLFLLSLRFWSFALGFFGLGGATLTWLGAGVLVAPLLAGALGLGAGYGASRVLGGLARSTVGLLPGADSHVGREGEVLLPVAPNQRGKIRVSVGGASLDLIAETEGSEPLPMGSTALVVGIRGTLALVERSPASAALPAMETAKPPSV